MNQILDAGAMIAYLKGEVGATMVNALLQNKANVCYAHAINLCEVYYDFLRASDEHTARQAVADLLGDGIRERKDLSQQFWRGVGRLKARGRISLADCFASLWHKSFAVQLSPPIITNLIHLSRLDCVPSPLYVEPPEISFALPFCARYGTVN